MRVSCRLDPARDIALGYGDSGRVSQVEIGGLVLVEGKLWVSLQDCASPRRGHRHQTVCLASCRPAGVRRVRELKCHAESGIGDG